MSTALPMGDRLRQLEEPLRSQAQSVWRDLHASAARSGQANVATAERIAKITRDIEAAHAALRSRASGAAGAIKGMHPRTAVFGAVAVGALAFGRTLGNFHRINPGNVKRVAHALALDEERARFEPSYWDPPATAITQIDEVWFSGCHTNIGGGYVDANLSNIALFWMLSQPR